MMPGVFIPIVPGVFFPLSLYVEKMPLLPTHTQEKSIGNTWKGPFRKRWLNTSMCDAKNKSTHQPTVLHSGPTFTHVLSFRGNLADCKREMGLSFVVKCVGRTCQCQRRGDKPWVLVAFAEETGWEWDGWRITSSLC